MVNRIKKELKAMDATSMRLRNVGRRLDRLEELLNKIEMEEKK